MRLLRLLNLLTVLAGLALALVSARPVSAATPVVYVLTVEGVIVPVVGDYVHRGLSEAERDGAAAVLIELSTPGGAYDTTQEIVEHILNARVPVIVYVSPSGGWAGSAGTFITLSAHVAAMAPGSRIGAAHPISTGGELTPTQQEKVTEDAAAFIRSIAVLRGRDPERAESAVRQSKSFSDVEALQGNLIDIRAADVSDLVRQVEGRKVTLSGGKETTLSLATALFQPRPMSGPERFLQVISNPNIAYILLSVGSLGIIAELYNPGLIFPGVVGGLSLVVGLYSLGVLNAYWGGQALILLAIALFVADVFVTSHGILTAGGVASLILGSLVLFTGGPEAYQVNRGLIAGVVVSVSAFFIFIIAAVWRGQRRKAVTGREGLIGQTGTALTPLQPAGTVLVEGERWTAIAPGQQVEPGEEIVVTRVEGLKLTVAKKAKP